MSGQQGAGVGFRTLQAIHDLRAVVSLADEATLARISAHAGVSSASSDLLELVGAEGCRIAHPGAERLHEALILAAALPDEDFGPFQTATAILVADRLQHGRGGDDLFWHWDAFREHYATASPPVRAAIMNGFLRMETDRLVSLQDPPDPRELITLGKAEISQFLRCLDAERAAPFQAMLDVEMPDAGFWEDHCIGPLTSGAEADGVLLRAIRHIFEAHPDWDPYGARDFDPSTASVPTIPFIGA